MKKNYIVDCGSDFDSANKVLNITPGGEDACREFAEYATRGKVYILVTDGKFETWDSRDYSEDDYKSYDRVTAKDILNKPMKKEKKAKPMAYKRIEEKEVTKTIPKPKYRRGDSVLLSTPLGTFESYIDYSEFDLEKEEWVYTIPHKIKGDCYSVSQDFTETDLKKYLIK